MDTFARALLAAAEILKEGVLPGAVAKRYSSYDSGIGKKIDQGETSFEELEVRGLNRSKCYSFTSYSLVFVEDVTYQ